MGRARTSAAARSDSGKSPACSRDGRGGLEVEREGVVDLAADLAVGEVLAEGVAAGGSDDVLVEDVVGAGVGVGEDEAVFGAGTVVGACTGLRCSAETRPAAWKSSS